MSLIKKLKCWWRHDWAFAGGNWIIPEKLAVTRRSCQRCGLYQETSEDHVNHIRICDLSVVRLPIVPPKYPDERATDRSPEW